MALMAVFVQFCCRFASALCSLAQEKQSVSVLGVKPAGILFAFHCWYAVSDFYRVTDFSGDQ
ncbi:hypothetical protein KDM89_00400 [Undibacterium sp. LFS511W]|uniref:Secreted protein n=1 Tax=Undibacterium luofuense TaxID=2828733 RepID=A0A941DIE4_9BURK|nr:hypothetical protein [Undibacterium luofuense]